MPVKNADGESKALSKILFIEDDPLFRESTKELLEGEGFFVKEADSKNKAIEIGFEELFDLYLVDINLPEGSGTSFLREIRSFGDKKPVIMLTSHTSPKVAVECLEAGCDDFVRKGCDPEELIARIKSKLASGRNENNIPLKNGFVFDVAKKILLKSNTPVDLSQKETELLTLLIKNKNLTVTIETIEDQLWPASKEPSYGSIRVYINSLKKIIAPNTIVNIKGVGYRLED